MHEYDIAFKLILQQWTDIAMEEIAGTPVARWLSVELPEVRNTRVDLLGETAEGELVHIELQSTNDPAMALRMAEYCLRVYPLFGKFPRQVLLYVGEAPMRMPAELNGPKLQYSYRIVDLRDLNGERMLESTRVGDNIVAILTRLPDPHASLHRVMERIARLEPGRREDALARLMLLAGLRKLGPKVEEEARQMPILNDIMDHEVLGRVLREGELTGEKRGELRIIRRQIQKRFGAIPGAIEAHLAKLSSAELETLADRLIEVNTLEELLG